MIYDSKRAEDGFSYLRGMDSGKDPGILGRMTRDMVSFASNTRFRSGFAETRPGFKKVSLSWEDTVDPDPFLNHAVQGAALYDPVTSTPFFVVMAGGLLFRVTLKGSLEPITMPDSGNNPYRPRAWFKQVEQFLVIQDGESKPLIFDGASVRRAQPDEVPVGTCMAYGNGRLWVAVYDKYFLAGDIVGGPSGTAIHQYNDAALKFTENTYLNEGGYFRVPLNAGKITAMEFAATPDTSLGQGSLLVFTSDMVVSVDVPIDRDQWKNTSYPIQTIALIDSGALADRSTVLVNGDVWFRARDGLRSFAVARREIGQWGYTPMSTEMDRVLLNDTEFLLEASSAVVFDNRLLMTCSPAGITNGCYHRGLIALDFHGLSSMGQKSPPAYDGLWTGLNIYTLLKGRCDGVERAFAFTRDDEGHTELWELTKDDAYDNGSTRIVSTIETVGMGFKSVATTPTGPDQLKKLGHAELWADQLRGTVDLTVSYRPDQYPGWISWTTLQFCATDKDCTSGEAPCRVPKTYQPIYKARQKLCSAESGCETGQVEKDRTTAYEFQAKIQWTGPARLRRFTAVARPLDESQYGETPSSACQTVEACEDYLFSYAAS